MNLKIRIAARLAVFSLCLWQHYALAQVQNSKWECGQYRRNQNCCSDVLPPTIGPVISDNQSRLYSINGSGSFQEVQKAQVVFSQKAIVYDENGNALATEYIVRPSADVSGVCTWDGDATQGSNGHYASVRTKADCLYFGRVVAKSGAPAGAAIPIIVRIRGFASSSHQGDGQCCHPSTGSHAQSDFQSTFTAQSGPAELHGLVFAGCNDCGTYNEYDQTAVYTGHAGDTFNAYVEAFVDVGVGSDGTSHVVGEAEGFADPSIEIDPSYPDKDFFYLQFSPDIPLDPPTLFISRSGTDITLSWTSIPTGFILQDSLDLTPNSWDDFDMPIVDTGTTKSVTYTPSTGSMFFRLRDSSASNAARAQAAHMSRARDAKTLSKIDNYF